MINKILYGGSFNPPTIAHYTIALRLMEIFELDLVFLPTADFYNKKRLVDSVHRLNMLQLVCDIINKESKNKAIVSDFELKLDKYYGTCFSIEHFKECYFVIGADNLHNITTWINYPDVLNNKFIIIPRDDFSINEYIYSIKELREKKDNFIILRDFPEINISSSIFRKEHTKEIIQKEVFEYIEQNKLYKEDN